MDGLLEALDALLQRFLDFLNSILRILERLVQLFEQIVRVVRQFLRIIFSYFLIFLPPALGLLFSIGRSSVTLLVMTMLLVLLLAYAFITRKAGSLIDSTSRTGHSSSTKAFAFFLTLTVMIVTYSVSVDAFIGVLIFIGEFAIVYVLRAKNWKI